ncbi:MAG: aminoacyl-tRNA hydrolase [Chitinophagales bacterium]
MKYLIAGLGNIGAEYHATRHNIGFDVLDTIAEKEGFAFESERLADYATWKFKGRHIHFIKPTTYMNLSGRSVAYWLDRLKLSPDKLLVITDDLALPLGKLRLKSKGSDGGHNGLKNIIEHLGTQNYPRLRFGIGNGFNRGQQIDFVLGKWEEQEHELLNKTIERCSEAVKSYVTQGLARTMNQFN